TGPLLGVFIVYHLLHMTTGTLHPSFHETDVYRNVVTGFRVWYISALYFIAMLALGLHLFHGIWSMFQTVGIHRPKHDDPIRSFATIATILIVAGFIAVPLGVLLGIIS
ncbi:MAG TPA: succinate dehydrogenase, partial [Blastocatellia bacterium]|nr:succinate dehydrogenase [Blastocatellia bacterium]